jgi:hypothetical protein
VEERRAGISDWGMGGCLRIFWRVYCIVLKWEEGWGRDFCGMGWRKKEEEEEEEEESVTVTFSFRGHGLQVSRVPISQTQNPHHHSKIPFSLTTGN